MPKFLIDFISDFSMEIAVSFFTYIVTLIVGFVIGRTHDTGQCRKLKRILGFDKDAASCEVILPTWEGTLEYTQEEILAYEAKNGVKPEAYEYIRSDESEALVHIQNICNISEIKAPLILKSHKATKELIDGNNKFFCGGPLSCIYLKRIFSGEGSFSFKSRFLFGCSQTWMSRSANAPFLDIEREAPSTRYGRFFFVEKVPGSNEFEQIHIPKTEGFIFLIKKTLPKKGTHFICFGNSALTSMSAVKHLIKSTDEIYNITKKYKKHFFIIIRCSQNGEIDFEKDPSPVIDLTEQMFGTEKHGLMKWIGKKRLFKSN